MHYFDLHIHSAFSGGNSSLEQLSSTAKELGYSGICFAEYFKNYDKIKSLYEHTEKIKNNIGMEIFLGFEARNRKEIDKLSAIKKKFDVLLVRGGDLELNRIACETPQVDILTHPEYERFDSGLNHVLMKLAAKNNVAIEINFREILIASKGTRSKILSNIENNIRLAKKFHAPVILCSGAISHFELRSPECMISIASQLGLELNDAKNSMSKIPEKILNRSKERKSEEWISPGIKVVK
jgi:ribonuclease P/MRP protein subunit RPP1